MPYTPAPVVDAGGDVLSGQHNKRGPSVGLPVIRLRWAEGPPSGPGRRSCQAAPRDSTRSLVDEASPWGASWTAAASTAVGQRAVRVEMGRRRLLKQRSAAS